MWIKTYGNLYKKLVSTTGEIPIGIYRSLIKEKPKYQRLIVNYFFFKFSVRTLRSKNNCLF
jgi:hypothetical protein